MNKNNNNHNMPDELQFDAMSDITQSFGSNSQSESNLDRDLQFQNILNQSQHSISYGGDDNYSITQ